jgi:[acyl-carrier-protein] S-malonyltransferase
MARPLYEDSHGARAIMDQADTVLGFSLTSIMFNGTEEDLRQTKVTQPAIFLHSIAAVESIGELFRPDMVAGHSLGEFSALVAAKALAFEDGLRLVSIRAQAMQRACEARPGTMAAILGMEDADVERICKGIADDVVVAANYNSSGQLVISGTVSGIDAACAKLTEAGAKRAIKLPVGGAFHSPLMEPAREELAEAIHAIHFERPMCPVYQNVTGQKVSNPDIIKANLISQLTAPVRWTQTMIGMLDDGANQFSEMGPGAVLTGLLRKVNRQVAATQVG